LQIFIRFLFAKLYLETPLLMHKHVGNNLIK
jgi:hypothetical protein